MAKEFFFDPANTLPEDFKLRLFAMHEKYSGYVRFLPSGTKLYHGSKDPDELVRTNAFDIARLSPSDAGIFFTLIPVSRTNIVVTINKPLLLFYHHGQNGPYEERILPAADARDITTNSYLSEEGFDGHIEKSTSDWVTTRDKQGRALPDYEVNIFTPALPDVSGGIEKFSPGLIQK